MSRQSVSPEEKRLVDTDARLTRYVAALKSHNTGSGVMAMRRLLRLVRDYPREPLIAAVDTAAHYGLYDLDRLERMVLRQIATDYFVVPNDPKNTEDDEDDNDR